MNRQQFLGWLATAAFTALLTGCGTAKKTSNAKPTTDTTPKTNINTKKIKLAISGMH